MEPVYCTYIVLCRDGTLYTGWTNNLERRMKAHASGHGCKYTCSHGFLRLAYVERHATKHDAMHREWEIKQLRREEKLQLIQNWEKE